MKEILHRCFMCGRRIAPSETYLLAEGPKSDVVRYVCRTCYVSKSLEIRQAVRQEGQEGFIP